jgi:uncharacterized protein
MTFADVYFARFTSSDSNRADRIRQLLESIRLQDLVNQKDLCAIKVHIGEAGCKTHMEPALVAEAVKIIKSRQAIPFITDTAVLYRSRRSNAADHMVLAHEHGFDMAGIGAPFFPADGLRGTYEAVVPINGRHYQEVPLAATALEATSLVVFSHVTGHLASGLGATIKNIGMGFSTRKGKLSQHSTVKPKIKQKKCTDCQECIEWCPENAITDPEGTAIIDPELCIGCGQCLAVCRFDAVAYNWAVSSAELQERMAEHALGLMEKKRGKIVFINLLLKMTKDCDCLGDAGNPVVPDIGALASLDPVAIDQATLDLISHETGNRLGTYAYPALDEDHQIRYGEQIGLGSRKYSLIQV